MNGFARNAAPFFRSSRLRSSPAQPEMYKTGICGRYVNAPGFVDEYTFRGRGGQVLEPFFELAHLFQELGFSSPLDAHGPVSVPSISERFDSRDTGGGVRARFG